MVREHVVKTLPVLKEVKAGQGLQSSYLMEAYDAALVECDEQLAT